MAIAFPSNPTIGATFTSAGKTWTWNGGQWEGVPAEVGIPSGESSGRPANPTIGDQYYNGTLGVLEIYTASGWLPATGANDFNVAINGEESSATFTKEYFAGAYTIVAAIPDTTFDIYLYSTDGSFAGYSNSAGIFATKNFNKIVILGGTSGNLLSFTYKTTFTTQPETSEVTAGPVITNISPTFMNSKNDTTTITGKNFATDITVSFTGTDSVVRPAKSVVRNSATSLTVTRPDDLPEAYDPYRITLENPGVIQPTGSNRHIALNAITSGATPVWSTSITLPNAFFTEAYNQTVVATDADNTAITYTIVSGSLPTGLSLSTSGVISGTTGTNSASAASTTQVTIRATDAGGNYSDRQFTIPWLKNVNTATGAEIAASYPLLYLMATDATLAYNNVSKMQGYAAQITTTLTNSGKATNGGAWGASWPFDISQGPTNGKIFVGLNGTDDGDSNTTLYQVNEAGQTQVYYKANTQFSDQTNPVVFRGARLVMGGGSVGTMYVSNVWTLTAP